MKKVIQFEKGDNKWIIGGKERVKEIEYNEDKNYLDVIYNYRNEIERIFNPDKISYVVVDEIKDTTLSDRIFEFYGDNNE